MTKKRVIIIVLLGLALALGLIATIAFQQQLSKIAEQQTPSEKNAPQQEQAVGTTDTALRVLVADQRLVIGDTIEQSDIAWRAWPRNTDLGERALKVDPTSDNWKERRQQFTEKVTGSLVRHEVLRGQPIPGQAWFPREKANLVPGLIADGMRAVTIDVDQRTGGNGFILPGHHIDVLVSREAQQVDDDEDVAYRPETVVERVVGNVEVVAVNQSTTVEAQTIDKEPQTLTLEVSPAQAQKIHAANQLGQFGVTLRSIENMSKTSDNDKTPEERPFTTDRAVFDDYAQNLLEGKQRGTAKNNTPGGDAEPTEQPNETGNEDDDVDDIVIYRNGRAGPQAGNAQEAE